MLSRTGKYRPLLRGRTHVGVVIAAILFVAFALSAVWRTARTSDHIEVLNSEATYHALLTAVAYDRIPYRVHKFLPPFNLGAPTDVSIPRGDTVGDSRGNVYYLSFPAAGFVLPWIFFKLSGLAPSSLHLLWLNLLIHLGAIGLLSRLIWNMTADEPEGRRATVTLLAGASYVFALEALYSHGIIYWHHSLFQIAWISQLIALHRIFTRGPSRLAVTGLLAASFAAPMIEWTGYLANGMAAVALAFARQRRLVAGLKLAPALLVCCATLAAGALTMAQIAAVVDLQDVQATLTRAFFRRSAAVATSTFIGLLRGYWDSFGALAIAGALALVAVLATWRRRPVTVAIVLIALVPALVENVLMLQHATQFSFDRLKLIVPIAIALAALCLHLRTLRVAAPIWGLAIGANALAYAAAPREADISGILEQNRLLHATFADAPGCMLIGSTYLVRGWTLLTLDRGVYEAQSIRSLVDTVDRLGACGGILIMAARLRGGASIWRDVIAFQREDKDARSLLTGITFPLAGRGAPMIDRPFPLSDINWLNGVARKVAGFFVEHSAAAVDIYRPGRTVVFADGQRRKITHASPAIPYLNVWVEGAALDGEIVGYPHSLAVVD